MLWSVPLTFELSDLEARRIALRAQGFASPQRPQEVSVTSMRRAIGRLGLLQIDSVNVLVRAHYMPLFSRLGPYDRGLLDAMALASSKAFFEYWGHEASLLPIELQPLLRWRMARAEALEEGWGGPLRVMRDKPELIARVLQRLTDEGPMGAGAMRDAPRGKAQRGEGIWRQLQPFAGERRSEADALLARIAREGALAASDIAGSMATKGMWVWSSAKHALEWLFWSGLVASTHRRGTFERVYDLPERVLPGAILRRPTPDGVEARRDLLTRAAKALGVATAHDLRDYYRIAPADALLPLQQLVEDGTLVPVRVRNWRQEAYLHKDARPGRRHGGATLLSPFDPLVWHRPRTERLFGFRYRLEIYTPAHRREHGYYVLPFLMDGELVARVDLKADRKAGLLIVLRAYLEAGAPAETMERLLEELRSMASWLNLSDILVPPAAMASKSQRPIQP